VTEQEEAIVPFRVPRDQIPVGSEFRVIWIQASLELLRENGLFDRYVKNLPEQFHQPLLHSIAGTWLPAQMCVEHYKACDALGVPMTQQVALGRAVAHRLQKTIFALGFRAAREAGVTPFTILKQFPANWEREWRGGGVGVFKVGPKDARIEIVGFTGAPIPYCRNGLRGVLMGLSELVCTKAYASEIRALCTDTTLGFRVAWA
jgi:hypothetical protein